MEDDGSIPILDLLRNIIGVAGVGIEDDAVESREGFD
jgi:hypothetical protein